MHEAGVCRAGKEEDGRGVDEVERICIVEMCLLQLNLENSRLRQ